MHWFRARPGLGNFLLLAVGMVTVLAVTSHRSIQTFQQWTVYVGCVLLVAGLCAWLMSLARTRE